MNESDSGINHLRARGGIAVFNFSCERDLLLGCQKRNSPDLSQVSIQSRIAFVHDANVFAGANRPLPHKGGILRCYQ